MNVIERARSSGRCPPSLLQGQPKEPAFEAAVGKVLDPNDLALSISSPTLLEDFKTLMKMAGSVDGIPGDRNMQTNVLIQRRCIILAIIGATPSSSSSVALILQSGFLSSVKLWLDDILNGSVGGVDLLLHLLTNITKLPVTKSVVKESGMGKAIGSVEKHSLCVNTPNEPAIKLRVKQIKDAWNKSVKALKEKKRDLDSPDSPSAAKKPRVDEAKISSFSSLLHKMQSEPNAVPRRETKPKTSPTATGTSAKISPESKDKADDESNTDKKKSSRRVKWQDHFGGDLTAAKMIDEEGLQEEADSNDGSVSWSDRKRRDRIREKELLAKVKKSKLMDDDGDGMGMDATPSRGIKATMAWRNPNPLPERSDAPPPQVNSKEIATQTARMASVTKAQYNSDYSVPSSPAPMSDVEQALDMTNQSSTVTQMIPFFVPQQVPEPVPAAPAPVPALGYPPQSTPGNAWGAQQNHGSLAQAGGANVATPELVQSLGLPAFLVGQDVQALQTLASTPTLLSTFVDSNGMYDQARLTSLVQTLSQNSPPSQPPTMGQVGAGYQQSSSFGAAGQQAFSSAAAGGGIYGPASGGAFGASSGGFGGASWQGGMKNGYRGDQNNGDGNLHISGYGPTTSQADIITLFAPYVQVDEVVMKGTFSFVNTSDPVGAKRAREALSGALLGGAPIRINVAQRKKRDDATASFGGSNAGSLFANAGQVGAGFKPLTNQAGFGVSTPGLPSVAGDFTNVRDDRGNPATKNLFVAGYGPGTSEHQLRELFGQHAQIIGLIMKGTFSFVNTSDRGSAIRAREVLSGTMLNGGVLRINFAKESGRLGTSFDVTYNSSSGGGGGAVGGGGAHSHYGRGF